MAARGAETTRVRLPGIEVPPAAGVAAAPGASRRKAFDLRPRKSFELATTRAAGVGASVEIEPDQLVLLELENGIRLWTSARQAVEDFGYRSASQAGAASRGARSAGVAEFEIPAVLPIGSPSRGVARWVLRALHVFDVDPVGAAADLTARAIADRVESRLVGKPGIHRCRLPDGRDGSMLDAETLSAIPASGGEPILVLLHGTASSTDGSFGGLGSPAHRSTLERLFHFYGQRVYALEHRTLSVSPIENALDLVEALPAQATLHLVSHSRGGLIGELICRGNLPLGESAFGEDDLAIFARASDEAPAEAKRALQAQARQLEELGRALHRKKIRVERFVRVGCPARGTTLASGRLDRWLSVGFNVLRHIAQVNPVAGTIADVYVELAAAVVKKRLDPSALPGLHAQTPASPLIALLNRPDVRTMADLSVIAGDLDGRGFLGSVAELATRWFFGADNDVVVDTRSMYGGARRGTAQRFFQRGPEVTHFNYFDNEASVRRLAAGLIGSDAERAQLFERLDVVPGLMAPRAARAPVRARDDGPVVFVLPGIMGSQLSVDGRLVWLDEKALRRGGFTQLAIDASGIEATAVDAETYEPMIDALAEHGRPVPYPYDWRLSIQEAAKRLAADVAHELDRIGASRPVQFVAHSMGGLVVRAMIAAYPELWRRVCRHDDARFVMLGTPNQGSQAITAMLLGQDFLVNLLAIYTSNSPRDILRIVKRYPGVLEMLPHWDDPCDFFHEPVWAHIMTQANMPGMAPSGEDLRRAGEIRALLQRSPIDARRMYYVAGCAAMTLEDVDFSDSHAIGFTATAAGDGRVLWARGIPQGLTALYVDAAHGDIPRHPQAIRACIDLLRAGTTSALGTEPPRARAAAAPFPAERPVIEVFPDARDIMDAAIGRAQAQRPPAAAAQAAPQARVSVGVTHGHLRVAKHPLLVGHYEGDGLVSAEAEIDRQLHGRLRQRYELGLYPGPLGTNALFAPPQVDEDGPPPFPGAIVVGLGKVGHLAPGTLAETLRRGLLELIGAADEGRIGSAGQDDGGIGVSALVVGGSVGGVGFRDAINALLRAVTEANAQLETMTSRRLGPIRKLQLIELYQDRAHCAFGLLQTLASQADYGPALEVAAEIDVSDGGLRRIQYDEHSHWWRSIQINAQNDRLNFRLLTDLARSEGYAAYVQMPVVSRFVDNATRSTATRPEISRSLFELLIPNELKEAAPRQEHLRLLLDEEAASFPWELLQDPFQRDARPLVVQAAVLRQLELDEGRFRQQPRRATADTALVIGDTDTGDMRDVFPELAGAQEESRAVSRLLESAGFHAPCRIRPGGDEVLPLLLSNPYRILHFAGHGVYRQAIAPDTEPVTGMVLGGGLYLSPFEIRQMRMVPELVFLNCCYLGVIRPEASRSFPRIAANLAAAFIDNGVRCVVAAGWEVDDAAAKAFAETFYGQMVSGETFASAVLQARRHTFGAYPDVNTWGAYQCYGDPDYRLRLTQSEPQAREGATGFASVEALCVELESLTAQVSTGLAEDRDRVRNRVSALQRSCSARWLERHARLSEAFARAFAACEDFAAAVECYRAGMAAAKADGSLAMLEELVNVSARQAARDALRVGPDGGFDIERVRAHILQLQDELAAFTRKYPTRERWCLLGSALRRLAMVEAVHGDVRAMRAHLAASVANYEQANRLPGAFDPYPGGGAALGLLLGRWGEEAAMDTVERLLADFAGALDPRAARSDFWASVHFADLALLRALHALASGRRTLPSDSDAEAVTSAYARAMQRGVNWQQRRSVEETFELIACVLARRAERTRGNAGTTIRRAVKFVRTAMQGLGIESPV